MAEVTATAPAVLPDIPAVTDQLNFWPYARTLLDIILNPYTETPLTIGIFGSWGSGKTSLMKMIEAGLRPATRDREGERQTFTVWFNAWLYSKEETLWRALVMQVLAGVRRIRDLSPEAKAELDALADQLYRAAGPSELGRLTIRATDLLKEDGTSGALLSMNLQHGLDLLENVAQASQQGELAATKALRDQVRRATSALEQERIESLEKFQTQFEDLVQKHVLPHGYLVVFVDDLDRCLPDKAVEVLEAIKLFLDVPGCIFILGIDRDVIERGIRLRYGELGGMGGREAIQLQVDRAAIESETGVARYRAFLQDLYADADDVIDGGRYLEKIVQIPFVLPPISPQAMGSFVAQLTPNPPDPRCGLVFVRGLEPNPRQVKRALNIFALLWALAQNQPYLAERISPVRLAKLVVLQQRHPDLYERLREDPSLLIAWERAFRVRRDREVYQEWAQAAGSEWQGADSLWSLEAPFPKELEVYEEQAPLEILLTMHSLVGEDAEAANFVDMTPQEVRDLVFLAYTAEGGKGFIEEEPEERERRYAVPETGPIPLHEFLRLSEEEASFLATQTLEPVIKTVQILKQGKRPVGDMKSMTAAGRRLGDRLRSHASEVMAVLSGESRTIQTSFGGYQGSLMARLPWEMVYDGDEDPTFEKVPLTGFWGGRHIIERPLALTYAEKRPSPPQVAIPIEDQVPRVHLILDWGIDASPALRLFAKWHESGHIQLRPIESLNEYRESLLVDSADIYVFYSRGWEEVGEGQMGIGKGYGLRAREMLSWAESYLPQSTLFYFCLQGDPTQKLDWSEWMPALREFGAASLVAPLIYTPGEWPLQLMRHFFDQFLEGKPAGEALRDARLRLFEEAGSPLGLLYVQFGPPQLRLMGPSEYETED